MMDTPQHLFFDLDKTLWDFERNSREVIADLFLQRKLDSLLSDDFQNFFKVYERVNMQLWEQLRKGEIDKAYLRANRFHLSMLEFGYDNAELGQQLDKDYLEKTPLKKNLIAYSIPVLSILSQRYRMHIITNGFDDVQHFKLENCGLKPFFDVVITSDRANAHKPERAIFDLAMRLSGARPDNAVMIGDDADVDVKGAINAGMRAIWFNQHDDGKSTADVIQIACLSELLHLL
jgi:putative hydrolase of the HAD superfamily